MSNFFDLIPIDDPDPEDPILEPYDEQQLDDLFERFERGDDQSEPDESA